MSNNCNYYTDLEIERGCTNEQVANAYRRLALKYHPKGKHPNTYAINNHNFHKIAEAYIVLIDPNKRGIYDVFGADGLRNGITDKQGNLKGGFKYSGNAEQVFEKFFGTANPFTVIKDFDRNDDEQGTIFGAAFGGQYQQEFTPLSPVEVNLNCSLEELYLGGVKKLFFNKRKINDDGRTTSDCVDDLNIEIFRGYRKDKLIEYPAQGNEYPGEVSSNLNVRIAEIEHPRFKRVDNDLVYVQKITLQEALASEPVILKTLDERVLTVAMDEIISPQTVKCVRGEGMPIYEEGNKLQAILSKEKRGDLYIKFNIQFPKFIDPESKEEIIRILDLENETMNNY